MRPCLIPLICVLITNIQEGACRKEASSSSSSEPSTRSKSKGRMRSSGTGTWPASGCGSTPTGKKVYVVQSRGPGGPKRVTLGRHGDISTDEARKQAAAVIDRIKRGEEPKPGPPEAELTVAGLAERFMRVYAGRTASRARSRSITPYWRITSCGLWAR